MPLIYNFFAFNLAQRNYDTYKRKLLVIITFATKYTYILITKNVFIIYIDYKPLVGFINSDYYKNIFARQANKLRTLYIKITYIKGEINKAANGLLRALFNNLEYIPN